MKPIRAAGHIGKNKASIYACIDCGKERRMTDSTATAGLRTRCPQCGSKITQEKNTVHGETHTKLYNVWNHIYKDSCWPEYLPFKEWARNNGYKEGLHPIKIDVNKMYDTINLAWSDHAGEQMVRVGTKRINNTSGYVGVAFKKGTTCPWLSRVYYRGKAYNLGQYATPRKAASVRNQFIIEKGFPHKLAELY